MSKNVIETNKNIIVQEELYNEILNGFENEGGTSCKKTLMLLSPIQKIRVSLVSESFFANEKTNSFVNEWVTNLKVGFDETKLLNVAKLEINKILKSQREQVEEELEEEDDDKGKSFNILNSLKIIQLINAAGDTAKTVKEIIEFNQIHLEPIVRDIKILQINDKLSSQMKQMLIIGKLQDLMYDILSPLIPQLYKSIKNFYDSEKISKIIHDFVYEIKKEIAKEVLISVALYVASAVITYISGGLGGGSFAATAAITTARYGRIALQIANLGKKALSFKKLYKGTERAYKGIKKAHKAVKSSTMYKRASAINTTRQFAEAGYAVYDFYHLTPEEARQFADDIREFQDENVVPFVNKSNKVFDTMERSVNDFKSVAYDYTAQKFKDYFDIEEGLSDVRDNFESATKMLTDKQPSKNEKSDFSHYNTQNNDYYIDASTLYLKDRPPYKISNIGNYVYSRSERLFNLVLTSDVHNMVQKMHFYKKLRLLNDIIYESFGNVAIAVLKFIRSIGENYEPIIRETYNSIKWEGVEYITNENGTKKERKYSIDLSKYKPPQNINNGQLTITPKLYGNSTLWTLYTNTLSPFSYQFINYAFVGFTIKLARTEKNALHLRTLTYKDLEDELYLIQDKQWYKSYINYFNDITKLKDIISGTNGEMEAENKLYEIVDGLLTKIMDKCEEI